MSSKSITFSKVLSVMGLCCLCLCAAIAAESATCLEETELHGDACMMLQKVQDLKRFGTGDACSMELPKLSSVSDERLHELCQKAFPKATCEDARAILSERPWSEPAVHAACGSFAELWEDRMMMNRRAIGLISAHDAEADADRKADSLDKSLSLKGCCNGNCGHDNAVNNTNSTNSTKKEDKEDKKEDKKEKKEAGKDEQKAGGATFSFGAKKEEAKKKDTDKDGAKDGGKNQAKDEGKGNAKVFGREKLREEQTFDQPKPRPKAKVKAKGANFNFNFA